MLRSVIFAPPPRQDSLQVSYRLKVSKVLNTSTPRRWRIWGRCSRIANLWQRSTYPTLTLHRWRRWTGCSLVADLWRRSTYPTLILQKWRRWTGCLSVANLWRRSTYPTLTLQRWRISAGCSLIANLWLRSTYPASTLQRWLIWTACSRVANLWLISTPSNFENSYEEYEGDVLWLFGVDDDFEFCLQKLFCFRRYVLGVHLLPGTANFNEKYTDARIANPERGYFSKHYGVRILFSALEPWGDPLNSQANSSHVYEPLQYIGAVR